MGHMLMSPRRYNRENRDRAMAELRQRIVEAIVALHAEQGPLHTTYAMIAARAGVAIPTVYKHFPNLTALFGACVAHTANQAPKLTDDLFARRDTVAARLDALTERLFARHRALSPWLHLGQHEAHVIPELGVHVVQMRDEDLRFIRQALAPRFGTRPPEALVGMVDIQTRYSAWETLTAERGLSPETALAAVRASLAALVAAYASNPPESRPPSRAARRTAT